MSTTTSPSSKAFTIPNIQRIALFAVDSFAAAVTTFAHISSIFRETMVDYKTAQLIWARLELQEREKLLATRDGGRRACPGDKCREVSTDITMSHVNDCLLTIISFPHTAKQEEINQLSSATDWMLRHLFEHEVTRKLFRTITTDPAEAQQEHRRPTPASSPVFQAIEAKNEIALRTIFDCVRGEKLSTTQDDNNTQDESKSKTAPKKVAAARTLSRDEELKWMRTCPIKTAIKDQIEGNGGENLYAMTQKCWPSLAKSESLIKLFFDILTNELPPNDPRKPNQNLENLFHEYGNYSHRHFFHVIAEDDQNLPATKVVVDIAERKLDCLPKLLEQKDSKGYSAMTNAIVNGAFEIFKLLFEKCEEQGEEFLRTQLDQTDAYGASPFALSVGNREQIMFDYLLLKIVNLGLFKKEIMKSDENDDYPFQQACRGAVTFIQYDGEENATLHIEKLIAAAPSAEFYKEKMLDVVGGFRKETVVQMLKADTRRLEPSRIVLKLIEAPDCWEKCCRKFPEFCAKLDGKGTDELMMM